MAYTLRQFLSAKGLKEESVEEVISTLLQYWKNESKNATPYRKALMHILKRQKRLNKVERLFMQEYARFDAVFSTARLKDDPIWPKIDETVKRMKETNCCPFCGTEMKRHRETLAHCLKCNKVFHLWEQEHVIQ